MTDLTIIAGARPNFMKIASIIHTIHNSAGPSLTYKLVHTGQHYDKALSETFFNDLRLPEPDINLNVGSSSHAEQSAQIMVKFEEYLSANPSKYVVVVGDVNSTLACSIVAKKLNIKVVHVEGGLRSGDHSMPEEINRLVTDSITDIFFTTTQIASENLITEGHSKDKIYLVGNTMIDTLINNEPRFTAPSIFEGLELQLGKYLVMTLHRPSNVDDKSQLLDILKRIGNANPGNQIIFPVHPRTAAKLDGTTIDHIHFVSPMRYLEFMYLIKNSFAVITDSGGIQEETTFFNIPCITLRTNTERPETIHVGSNELVGSDPGRLDMLLNKLFNGNWKDGGIPVLWDGKTGERIVGHLLVK